MESGIIKRENGMRRKKKDIMKVKAKVKVREKTTSIKADKLLISSRERLIMSKWKGTQLQEETLTIKL